MTRLTKSTKNIILDRAMNDVFSERDEQDKRSQSELFREIVDHRVQVDQSKAERLYKELKQKAEKACNELGSERVITVSSDRFKDSWLVNGNTWRSKEVIRNYLTDDGKFVRGETGNYKEVTVERFGRASDSIRPDSVTAGQRRKLEDYWLSAEKLKDDKSRLRSKLQACLDSVTTVKKLIESYPDLEKYVPAHAKGTGVVLAVPPLELMAEINKAREGGKRRRRKSSTASTAKSDQ